MVNTGYILSELKRRYNIALKTSGPCHPGWGNLPVRDIVLNGGVPLLNSETMSAEAKIGRILILVSVVIGILAIIIPGSLIMLAWPSGEMNGFGITMVIPVWILISLVVLQLAGLALGGTALYYSGKNELMMAGIPAAVSSVLPPST